MHEKLLNNIFLLILTQLPFLFQRRVNNISMKKRFAVIVLKGGGEVVGFECIKASDLVNNFHCLFDGEEKWNMVFVMNTERICF
jgi:hypothetical protein